jgi:hypothetical protein
MKLKSTLLACSVIILGTIQLFGLDNKGLIKLIEVGLEDATIILKMKTEPAEYDLSTDGLIALKQAGASDELIQAALRIQSGIPEALHPSSGKGEFSQSPIPSITVPVIQPQTGGTYFTRLTFFQEKNQHIATNYARGTVIPINTEVRLNQIKKKYFEIEILTSGEKIKIVNEPSYSGLQTEPLTGRYLADQKTPIEKLPEGLQVSVLAGELRLGMTKETALIARPQNPEHGFGYMDLLDQSLRPVDGHLQ